MMIVRAWAEMKGHRRAHSAERRPSTCGRLSLNSNFHRFDSLRYFNAYSKRHSAFQEIFYQWNNFRNTLYIQSIPNIKRSIALHSQPLSIKYAYLHTRIRSVNTSSVIRNHHWLTNRRSTSHTYKNIYLELMWCSIVCLQRHHTHNWVLTRNPMYQLLKVAHTIPRIRSIHGERRILPFGSYIQEHQLAHNARNDFPSAVPRVRGLALKNRSITFAAKLWLYFVFVRAFI